MLSYDFFFHFVLETAHIGWVQQKHQVKTKSAGCRTILQLIHFMRPGNQTPERTLDNSMPLETMFLVYLCLLEKVAIRKRAVKITPALGNVLSKESGVMRFGWAPLCGQEAFAKECSANSLFFLLSKS